MSWPGLATWEMHTPTTYVVDSDLRDLPSNLAHRYASELRQWRKRAEKKKLRREWLSPVQMAILSVQGLFRGLRPVDSEHLGCGIQVSADGWARILGCKSRAVTKAFAKLKSLGLVERWRRLIPHKWTDSGGIQRTNADGHGISYLTDAGAAWLAKHAGKTRRLVVLSTWEPGGRQTRALVAAGIVGKLLETLREKLKRLAHRLSPHKKQDRPKAKDGNERKRTEERRGSPVGNAQDRGSSRRTRASSEPKADKAVAGMEGDLPRFEQLWREGNLHPWTAWPKDWVKLKTNSKTGQPYGRTDKHWWLIRLCEGVVRYFSKLELERRVAAPSTGAHNWSEYE